MKSLKSLCISTFLVFCLCNQAFSQEHLFPVKSFGAKGDGTTKDTVAIQGAIDAAAKAGGGRVLLTPGTYLSGTIHLKSRVDLHLMAGAVLLGSPDREDYNAADFCPQNQAFASDFVSGGHLVVAVEQDNISITGPGRIDGNAKAFNKDPGSDRFLPKNKIPWRPAQMIFLCECTHVRIRDVQMFHSPYWTCFLHGCEDILIDSVRIWNRRDTANGDGIDLDCCQRAVVTNCLVESGDDCITIRANDLPLKKKRACENIIVSNCVLKTACQAVRVGVGNGTIRNCIFSNLAIHDTNVGLNFHSSYNPGSPGTEIDNIRFENITMQARVPFTMTYGHAGAERKIQNVHFRSISGSAASSSPVGGKPEVPLYGISFRDVSLTVPSGANPFPGIKFSHIEGLELENVRFFESNQPNTFEKYAPTFEEVVSTLLQSAE